MKVSVKELRRIISEEVEKVMAEQDMAEGLKDKMVSAAGILSAIEILRAVVGQDPTIPAQDLIAILEPAVENIPPGEKINLMNTIKYNLPGGQND